jgi:hypothetical protein
MDFEPKYLVKYYLCIVYIVYLWWYLWVKLEHEFGVKQTFLSNVVDIIETFL